MADVAHDLGSATAGLEDALVRLGISSSDPAAP